MLTFFLIAATVLFLCMTGGALDSDDAVPACFFAIMTMIGLVVLARHFGFNI